MEFEKWLKNRLIETVKDLGLEGFTFDVFNEQDYTKRQEISPKRIYVCVKHLTASRIYASQILPLQITIVSEENSVKYAQEIFNRFCAMYNWYQLKDGTTIYKMEFSSPSVMDNFNTIFAGLRSILFVSASLIILENVADITNLKINGDKIDVITACCSYGANMDSVQFPNEELASSIKNSGGLNISITIASQNTNLVNKALNIMFGLSSGNEDFTFEFDIGNIHITNLKMKQQSCIFANAINDIPSIQIGYMK